MKQEVTLAIKGCQTYQDQEPEIIELMTDGIMELRNGGWDISYEESELTGLAGVTTTFRVEPNKVILTRTGALKSEMVFEKGIPHDSLYQMAFGTLMITVEAKFMYVDITPAGGSIDLVYAIDIENTACGEIDYHLDIRAK